MPEFTFAGTTPHEFPESRHADGTPVRSVEPGEIRDLPEPISHQWRETTDEDRAAWAAVLAGRGADGEETAAEAAAEGEPASETAETAPPAAPARPRRDKAAVIPSASEAGTAGTGTEA